MRDLDYLQIVILKHPDDVNHFSITHGEGKYKERGVIAGIPRFIHEIELFMGQFKITSYGKAYYNRKDIEIKEQKTRYLMKLPGFFFLYPDYKEKLKKIIEVLKNYTAYFHLTRLDMAWTLEESFQEVAKLLAKIKCTDTIERTIRDKAKLFTRVIFYNTRFMSIAYNKMKQVKRKKKKDEDYKKFYFLKYQNRETRIEHRLLSKAELVPMSDLLREDLENFFSTYENYVLEKAGVRLTWFPPQLRKMLSM